jgi:hypothetical protein
VITHLELSKNYLNNPPPDDWDGIHSMTTKWRLLAISN